MTKRHATPQACSSPCSCSPDSPDAAASPEVGCGGVAHEQRLPLSRPDITELERQAVMEVLGTDRLSMGPWVERFERRIADMAGRAHGIAVNSGTSGLHLCVRGLGLSAGDEVITTPFSFIATTNCLLYEGVKPVFVDIDPVSYNLDPDKLAAALSPRTRAILPVEVFGNMAHFELYEQFAREHGLLMIEDSCEALGGRTTRTTDTSAGDRSAGSFGDAGVFAFYPNKQITSGEGGVIVTDRDDLAAAARSMRNQGRGAGEWHSYVRMGFNYRLSEINAAIGATQMSRLDDILTRRRAVAAMYHRLLAEVEEIHLPPMASPDSASWFVYVIRLADSFSMEQRDAVVEFFHRSGIGCEKYFQAIHWQPFIREALKLDDGAAMLPVCERVARRTLALPFFTTMTEQQVRLAVATLKEALAYARGLG